MCAEDAEELGEPGVERRPSRASDEVAVHEGFIHREADVRAAAKRNVRASGGIGAALSTLKDSRDSENLRRVANRRERFIGFRKVVNDLDDPRIEAKIFDRAAAGNHQGVVVFRLDLVERGVERKIVPALLGIRLIAFEIVDAGSHKLTRFFAVANGVNGVADHL